MSASEERAWLVAYDITDSRRLARLHHFLKQHALAVQYSVFAALLNERQMEQVVAGVRALIEESEDDVRVYPLPARCETHLLGPRQFPEGIELVDRHLVQVLGSGELLGRKANEPLSADAPSGSVALQDGEPED